MFCEPGPGRNPMILRGSEKEKCFCPGLPGRVLGDPAWHSVKRKIVKTHETVGSTGLDNSHDGSEG